MVGLSDRLFQDPVWPLSCTLIGQECLQTPIPGWHARSVAEAQSWDIKIDWSGGQRKGDPELADELEMTRPCVFNEYANWP